MSPVCEVCGAENPQILKTELHSHSSPGEFTAPVLEFWDCTG